MDSIRPSETCDSNVCRARSKSSAGTDNSTERLKSEPDRAEADLLHPAEEFTPSRSLSEPSNQKETSQEAEARDTAAEDRQSTTAAFRDAYATSVIKTGRQSPADRPVGTSQEADSNKINDTMPDSEKLKIPFGLSSEDCYQSRLLKSEYSGKMNSLKDSLDQAEALKNDIHAIEDYVNGNGKAPEGIVTITKNGEKTTVRIEDTTAGPDKQKQQSRDNTSWTEYTYSSDGSYMEKATHGIQPQDMKLTLKDNTYQRYVNGKLYSTFSAEDGEHMTLTNHDRDETISLNGSEIKSCSSQGTDTYSVNRKGELSKTCQDGSVFTAGTDGSYEKGKTGPGGEIDCNSITPPGTGPGGTHDMAYYDSVAKEMGSVVDRDANISELSSDQQYILAQSLASYSPDVLDKLQDARVQYMVFKDGNWPPGGLPGGSRLTEEIPASYDRDTNIMSIRDEDLENGGSDMINYIIHHETGHAMDDILSDNDGISLKSPFHTDNDPRIGDLYNNYVERTDKNPDTIWSKYGKTKKVEYFAEGMAHYFGTPEEKGKLKTLDPELYDYLDQLYTQKLADPSSPSENPDNVLPYKPTSTEGLEIQKLRWLVGL